MLEAFLPALCHPFSAYGLTCRDSVAVAQWFCKPLVGGSNPSLGSILRGGVMLAYKAHNLVIRVGFPTALPISGGVSERSIVAVLKTAEDASPPWVRIPPPPPFFYADTCENLDSRGTAGAQPPSAHILGRVVQLVRAGGLYPPSRWFKSSLSHQLPCPACSESPLGGGIIRRTCGTAKRRLDDLPLALWPSKPHPWFNGRTPAFQAGHEGSIPSGCSILPCGVAVAQRPLKAYALVRIQSGHPTETRHGRSWLAYRH